MVRGTGTTRDKLLDAASRLMAEKGLHNVSLAEVVRAAGQRNASAVHYHFGSRDDLLLAILERHVGALHDRRRELLESAEDARSIAEAIVRPVCELAQRGWRERAYLQIGSELISYIDRTTPEIRRLLGRTGGPEALRRLAAHCADVPPDVWAERGVIGSAFIGRAAADRARRRGRLDDDAWLANLVDMFLAAMRAPVSVSRP